jgi:hypothetical protein
MGDIERQPFIQSDPESEILDPHHFYAAYVFDQAHERETDIRTLIEEAQEHGYPVRYWWLSDAMELSGSPDRLIVCVHHPSGSENAGMDLYDTLKEKQVPWDDLEAAAMDEYSLLGAPVTDLANIRSPYGERLFPHAASEDVDTSPSDESLFTITAEDVREEAENYLGRELTDEELPAVLEKFKKSLEYLDWRPFLDEAIQMCQKVGQIGFNADELNNVVKNQ